MEGRLIVDKNFRYFTFAVQGIADCRILIAGVLCQIRVAEFFSSFSRPLHHFFDVNASGSDRQKPYSSKYGITSAYIVWNNKGLVAFFRRQLLKSAFLAIRCSVNAFASLFLAILLLERRAENTECNRWLCRRSGLGNDVDRKVLAFNQIEQMIYIGGTYIVTGKIDFRGFAFVFRKQVVKRM
ncbi:hypothetical protein D3C77_382680 [compost metagenome]